MGLEFLLPFIISYTILWIGFYIFQKINFKNKFEDGFSIRNTFTFETHNFNSETNKIVRIWYVIATLVAVVPFVVFTSTHGIKYTLNVHVLISSILLLISLLLKILLFFTKTINIKFFISLYVMRLLTFLGSILFMIVGIMTTISEGFNLYNDNKIVMWIFFTLFIILLIVNSSCLVFSKFYNWYNFEKDEAGQIKKPNTILPALYQWIFDYSEVIFVVISSIFLYFMEFFQK